MTARARRRLGPGLAAVAAAILAAVGFHALAAVAQEVVDLPGEDRLLRVERAR